MSQVLTTILQRDTSLKLVSLENQPSLALIEGLATPEGGAGLGVQVFRHGLRMVFVGNYLETIRYLRSLEQLDGNFFWDRLEFNLTTYPDGEISLEIYTLSTERGWIGV
jgi:MSHA biogenesis protein MshJ